MEAMLLLPNDMRLWPGVLEKSTSLRARWANSLAPALAVLVEGKVLEEEEDVDAEDGLAASAAATGLRTLVIESPFAVPP